MIRVLHFSTHAFASGNPRIEFMDGSLLLPDLYALPLQADLVMLSASETGLGKEEKGEGVMSLARAFAQAGAACCRVEPMVCERPKHFPLVAVFLQNIRLGHTFGASLREANWPIYLIRKWEVRRNLPISGPGWWQWAMTG